MTNDVAIASATNASGEQSTNEYVTVIIADQLFGLPIEKVQDVFMLDDITEVPLAMPEVAGVLNLRGRIVTAIDMRKRLRLPMRDEDCTIMAVGIEYNGESYGLLIDQVGDVLRLSNSTFEAPPVNLDPRWAQVAAGVHRLEKQLMVVFDVEKVLAIDSANMAA